MAKEVNVQTTCPGCGKKTVIEMPLDAYMKWQHEGELIQRAWPEATSEQREMLISGYDNKCWEKIFGDED